MNIGGKITMDKWDTRFLELAKHVAQWSKDPSTKCGAVIVRSDKTIASMGYNGFPRGIEDSTDLLSNREEKYKRVIHAEMNAILTAREPLLDYTLYTWPFMTCERCAVHVIQAGIKRVVSLVPTGEQSERWGESFHTAQRLYDEAGIWWELL